MKFVIIIAMLVIGTVQAETSQHLTTSAVGQSQAQQQSSTAFGMGGTGGEGGQARATATGGQGFGGEGGRGGSGGRGGDGGLGGLGGTGGNSNSDANSDSLSRSKADSYSGGNSVSYENDYKKTYQEYVAGAYAPPLAASGDCLGSASAGGSNSVMGFSLGKTYVDENCNARYDAALLWSMGRKAAAVKRLCSQPEMVKVLPECAPPNNLSANDVEINWED